jgi:hypothetical protein
VGEFDSAALNAFMRFPNVAVPAGALITEAFLVVFGTAHSGDPTAVFTTIYANAVDDAVAPTDLADHAAKVRTDVGVDWDLEDWPISDYAVSEDIGPVVAEVLGRPGWEEGNALMLLWDARVLADHSVSFATFDSSSDVPTLFVSFRPQL